MGLNEMSEVATGREGTDEVISYLRAGVLSGNIPPGTRLNASRIASALNTTIVPVREAIHYLAGEGLVDLLPLKGAQIRNFSQDEVVKWWRIFQALTEIELHAVAEKIVNSPQEAEKIVAAQERIEAIDPGKKPFDFLSSLTDFHNAMNSVSGEEVVREASRRLQVRFWTSFLVHYVPFEIYGKQFAKHYRIVAEALCRGDGAGAAAAFRFHVSWSSALIRGERPAVDAPWGSVGV